jgi:hypothetical protein
MIDHHGKILCERENLSGTMQIMGDCGVDVLNMNTW